MASNRGQGGIQQLLAAEQEAQHIVNAARSGNFSSQVPTPTLVHPNCISIFCFLHIKKFILLLHCLLIGL